MDKMHCMVYCWKKWLDGQTSLSLGWRKLWYPISPEKPRACTWSTEGFKNLNLRCIKYYFCCWSLTVVCSHLLGKFGSKVEACAHPWNKLSELQHKQLVKLYDHLIFSIIFKRTIWYRRNQNWHTQNESTNLLLLFANSPKIPHDMISSHLLAYLLQATVPDWQDQC